MLAGAVATITERPVVLVVAHFDEADDAFEELTAQGIKALSLPAVEVLPGETNVSLELFAERVSVLRRLVSEGAAAASVKT